MSLRGRRFLAVTEADSTLKLNSTAVKLLRDQSSVLQARNLYRDVVQFSPTFGLEISTNVKIKFTSIDGGITRSVTAMEWPFIFAKHPALEHERPVDTSLKKPAVIKAMLPGLLHVLLYIDKVFTKDWDDSIIGPRPIEVQDATSEALRQENLTSVEAFVERMIDTTRDRTLASTEHDITVAFSTFAVELNKRQVKDLMQNSFVQAKANSRRLLRLPDMHRGEYCMLK